MSELKACRHETLICGSGDYYLACPTCHAKWMRAAPGRAEYGTLPDGERVGAAPELCQPGFDMLGEWNRRALVPAIFVAQDDGSVRPLLAEVRREEPADG